MSRAKIAITIPEETLEAVDAAARERGQSRSAFISRVLRAAVRARRDREITRRLDSLFLDESVASEQRRVAAELDSIGTDWSDEAWDETG
jgi:metal-responsive CopG/Arc/MetJ family transcriptional regulator